MFNPLKFHRLALLLVLLAQALAPAPARATPTATITFEEALSQPDAIRTQYCNNATTNKGVEFLESERIVAPSVQTASPTHAITNQYPGQEFYEVRTVKIRFTAGQSQVSMKVGLDRAYSFPVTAVLYAYSSETPGVGFINFATTYLGYGPTAINQDLSFYSAAGDIRSVVVEFSGSSPGTFAFETIDDLSFSSIGPTCGADNDDPTVQISKPASDGLTFYAPEIELAFAASDSGSGVAKLLVYFLDASNAILDYFSVCGGTGAPPCPTPSNALTYDFYTYLPLDTAKIRVKAWDFTGRSGQAERTVDFLWPGPNTNLWAEALEITQGIQSWIPLNSQHNDYSVPTFSYPAAPAAVPLVAGRTTIVRLYGGLENTANNRQVDKVRAWLRCYTDSTFTTPCPGPAEIKPKQKAPQLLQEITLRPADTLAIRQRDTTRSWNFELPDSWTPAGIVNLEAEIRPPAGMPECAGCADEANRIRILGVEFDAVDSFSNDQVHIVQINRLLNGATTSPTQAQITGQMDFFRKAYPVDETTVSSTPNATWTLNDDSALALGVRCSRVNGLLATDFPNKANKLALLAFIDQGYPCSGRGGGGYGFTNAGAPAKVGAEEVGHSVGLSHAGPPPGHAAECSAAAGGCDSDWPWPHGTIGYHGFDILTMSVVVSGTAETSPHDFMSYGSPGWVSPRNWIRVFNAFTGSSLPYPTAKSAQPAGVEALAGQSSTQPAEPASYIAIRGEYDLEMGWRFLPIYEIELPAGSSDHQGEGDYTLELRTARGDVLFTRNFSIPTSHIDTADPWQPLQPPDSFSEILPLPEGVQTIVLSRGRDELAALRRDSSVPLVEIYSPNADGFEGQPENPQIIWRGADEEGDPLHFLVQYAPDAPRDARWQTLASDLTAEELAVSLESLPGGIFAAVRVLASDGFNTGLAISPNFFVDGKPPQVQILAPEDESFLQQGQRLALRGTAWDVEEGLLDPAALTWYSSQDGWLGEGRKVEVASLTPGTHEITLEALDGQGLFGQDVIVVEVTERINSQPIADAGPDQVLEAGDTVLLDGSGSEDADGDPLSFQWSIVEQPPGSAPWFLDGASATPGFFSAQAGEYQVELVVSDGQMASRPDRVAIQVNGAVSRTCPDFDRNNEVDISDLIWSAEAWGTADLTFDLNGDQLVTVADILAVAAAWGACTPPSPPAEDPFDIIHSVQVDENGAGRGYEANSIPEDAFTEEPVDPEAKPDDVIPDEPQRLHPVLAAMIEQNPDAVEPVIIVLEDSLQIPRFPDLAEGVARSSPEAEPYAAQAQDLIAGLLAERRAATGAFLAQASELDIRLPVVEQFWLINGFLTELPLRQVVTLLDIGQLTSIEPRFSGDAPPQDGNANNDVDDGRARIGSDPYFGLNLTSGYIGLLDTGFRTTHQLFNNPSHVDYVRDCVNGGANCNNSNAAGWNPADDCWNHGTSSAAILVGNNRLGNARRGVTAITLDSWQIYGHAKAGGGCAGLDVAATVRAFQRAVAVFDRVIVGEIQTGGGENGSVALAADKAYDAGAVVVAANGNAGPNAKSVLSPGLAHKAIGVGAYVVDTQAQYNGQGRGPAPDGRYKPDLQAPNETETASNAGDTALRTFGGTSGATPYAAGAAALLRNWLRQHNTYDNGAVYALLMNAGALTWPSFDNTKGLGQLRLPVCGLAWWGKVNVNQGTTIDIPIDIGANRTDLRAALWWPEAQSEQHDDVDLHLIAPNGSIQASSWSGVSIFERARVAGALTPGVWKARVRGYNIKSGPQPVYWAVYAAGC